MSIEKIILILFILFSNNILIGQHCGWDNTSIIIVEVRDSQTGKIINGLDIVLADSIQNIYTSQWNKDNNKNLSFYQNTDTLRFGQNVKTSSEEFSDVHGPFRFGIDNYMLLVYYNNYQDFNRNNKDFIIIKDKDGSKNLGRFKTKSINFSNEKIIGLCVDSFFWGNESKVEEIKIKVKLERME